MIPSIFPHFAAIAISRFGATVVYCLSLTVSLRNSRTIILALMCSIRSRRLCFVIIQEHTGRRREEDLTSSFSSRNPCDFSGVLLTHGSMPYIDPIFVFLTFVSSCHGCISPKPNSAQNEVLQFSSRQTGHR